MNLPQDFSRNMELLLGREAFLRLAEALDEPARVAFRPNDGKGFRVAGTLAAVPWSSYGHYLNERPAFTFDPLFHQGTVAVIAAGWDPGSDSVVRTLMQSLAPKGLSYTNFGPGMSMGHSVCVRSKEGVRNALSMTIPKGEGLHRRMVYVELEDGADLETVTQAIKSDPYFAHDETHVFQVPSVDDVRDMGHGVNLVRKGVSGNTQNQRFEFNMSINNPALTGQVLVNVARASMRQQPGCYTMIEIPVVDYLPCDRETAIGTLV